MSAYVLSSEGRTTIQKAIDYVQTRVDARGQFHSRDAAFLDVVRERFAHLCSGNATIDDAQRFTSMLNTRTLELSEETAELRKETAVLQGLIAFHELGSHEDDLITVN